MTETLQNQNQMQNQSPFLNQRNAPYAITALILGIASLVTGCLFVGLILGIVGLVLASKGTRLYSLDPAAYKGYGMLHAGKILSILGIVFGGISLLAGLITLIAGGSLFFFADMLDALNF